jgi:hypothetical protein
MEEEAPIISCRCLHCLVIHLKTVKRTVETLITIAHCARTPNLPPEYETEITTKTYDVMTVVMIIVTDGDYRTESSTVLLRHNAV